MAERRWIRVDTTWSQSEWVADLEPTARLAWIELLCYTKAHGFNGRVKKLATGVAARNWGVTRDAVTAMMTAAEADDAVRIEGDDWVIPKWPEYQGDPTNAERQKRYRQSRSRLSPLRQSRVTAVTNRDVTPTETETETETETTDNKRTAALRAAEFVEFWSQYPKRAGGNPKQSAIRAWNARIRQGVSPADLLSGLHRYVQYCEASELIGSQYVKQAATFLGPSRQWEESWDPPPSRANGISHSDQKLLEHRQRLENVNLNMGVWNDRSA